MVYLANVVQPIEAAETAAEIADHATLEAAGRVPDIGGPTVLSVRDLAQAYRAKRGLRRLIVRLPIPGCVLSAFRVGNATCPDRRIGTITWTE